MVVTPPTDHEDGRQTTLPDAYLLKRRLCESSTPSVAVKPTVASKGTITDDTPVANKGTIANNTPVGNNRAPKLVETKFAKQAEAVESNTGKPFAMDVHAGSGAKRFVTLKRRTDDDAEAANEADDYETVFARDRHVYEVLLPEKTTRLYLDLECPWSAGVVRVREIVDGVREFAGNRPQFERAIVLQSHRPGTKYSYHVIFPDATFADVATDMRFFVLSFVAWMTERYPLVKLFYDKTSTSKTLTKTSSTSTNSTTTSTSSNSTTTATVRTKRKCDVDTRVYTRNRNFRLLGQSKLSDALDKRVRLSFASNDDLIALGFAADAVVCACKVPHLTILQAGGAAAVEPSVTS